VNKRCHKEILPTFRFIYIIFSAKFTTLVRLKNCKNEYAKQKGFHNS
jgi:hypothetical protein